MYGLLLVQKETKNRVEMSSFGGEMCFPLVCVGAFESVCIYVKVLL